MNKRTTYEIIIAKKAAQCPLPDMADDIWASVKTQLHQQAESNDNNESGNTTQPKPPNGFTGLKMLLNIITASTIVVIISVIVWVNRDKNKPAPAPSDNIPPPYQPREEKRLPDPVYIKQPTPVRHPASVKNVQPVFDSSAMTADSLISEPVIIMPKVDSSHNQVLAPTDTSGVLPVIKKPRGVKGISNDDYKISPKDDSVKQRH